MNRQTRTAFDRQERHRGQTIWRSLVIDDTHHSEQCSIQQKREHTSAEAFVNGRRWYAKRLLEIQTFPNWHAASQVLIQNSRRLIAQSQQAIIKTKNILAFSREPQTYVN